MSYLFAELPFVDRFQAAADAGFRAVEFTFAYDHSPDVLRKRKEAAGVEVVLMNAPPGNAAAGERGLASLPGREEDFVGSMVQALEYARALGCRRIHVMAGNRDPRSDRTLQQRTLIANLHLACATAAEQGADITLEALNPVDAPGYYYSTQHEVHAVREEVGAPNLKAQMDFYHAQRVEGALTEKLERWLKHIGHIQIASVPGRHEPDVGEIDYRYVFRRIDELGYGGFVGCEYRPRTTTLAGLGWRERLCPH